MIKKYPEKHEKMKYVQISLQFREMTKNASIKAFVMYKE